MEIARTGNYLQLMIEGKADKEKCIEQWERIVKENAEENGSFEYDNYFELYQTYCILLAEFVLVKALLTYLCYSIDYTYIEQIRELGYDIDLTNTLTYTESLTAALQKSENINTKITTSQKELAAMFAENGDTTVREVKREGFEQVLAHLCAALNFSVNEDITLARYNEYKKIIAKRNKPKENQIDE